MVTLAKAPEYFRKVNFQNPSQANKGPFQYAEKTEKSQWEWLLDYPDLMKCCYNFLRVAGVVHSFDVFGLLYCFLAFNTYACMQH